MDDLARRVDREARSHPRRDPPRAGRFALRSHQLATARGTTASTTTGRAGPRCRAVPGRVDPRRTPRSRSSKLGPAFTAGGTVTAGNASPLNDGASALLIGDGSLPRRAAGPDRQPGRPRSRPGHLRHRAGRGRQPGAAPGRDRLGRGRGRRAQRGVRRPVGRLPAGLARTRPERLNPNGGAIAIGHPLGASGARILAGLAYELRRRGGGYGLAAICIGVGQGLAVVLEA